MTFGKNICSTSGCSTTDIIWISVILFIFSRTFDIQSNILHIGDINLLNINIYVRSILTDVFLFSSLFYSVNELNVSAIQIFRESEQSGLLHSSLRKSAVILTLIKFSWNFNVMWAIEPY